MLFHLTTFGCQMNEHDSESMAGLLEAQGLTQTEHVEEADIILINTCSIRWKAEEKAFSHAGRLKRLKETKPKLKIGFCGCISQREREQLFDRIPHLDFVFGTLNICELPTILNRVLTGEERVCQVLDIPYPNDNQVCPPIRLSRIKAWVKIMEGCNNFCTYCVVPYVRGRERSRSPHKIIEEVKGLAKSGYKEITLLGQNVNSFGKDLVPPFSFSELLYQLNKIPCLERIRFVTSHPKDLSHELIYAIKESEKVCEHIHLPLQSGSNKILKRMGRGYTLEEYMEKVYTLREVIPEISITGDMICGFPGETEVDFNQTLKAIEEVGYDGLFSFKFSPRPQTVASSFPDQLTEDIRIRRLQILQNLQNRIGSELNSSLLNREVPVLVEGASKKDPRKLTGRTRTNKVVNIEGPLEYIGRIVTVKITRTKRFDLEGIII